MLEDILTLVAAVMSGLVTTVFYLNVVKRGSVQARFKFLRAWMKERRRIGRLWLR